MHISVCDAKAQLIELVPRAESGDEVILTRRGHPVARLVPVMPKPDKATRQAALDELLASAKPTPGPDAAHRQDFLYDGDGLPK